MKILNVILFVVMGFLISCGEKAEQVTPSGMKFQIVKKGDGVLPKTGEIVVFNFHFLDSKDSTWAETIGMPAAVKTGDSLAIEAEDGMTQMLRMVSKGDSVIVSMSLNKFFRDLVKAPAPQGMDTTLMLTYRIRIDSIMSETDFMTYQMELATKLRDEQTATDIAIIDKHLADKGIDAVKVESGLRYVITEPGVGANAASGQTVKVNYAGYLLDGTYFDTSIQSVAQANNLFNPGRPYEPYEVTIDQSQVIQGWHDALKYMNKGSKATFYIPSTLAYGPQQRSEVIKENAILVFELEITDIK